MQGPKDFTTNHTDMLLPSLNPLGRLEEPSSPSSRGSWAVVGRQFSASGPVESELVSLSPWASRFTPEPQLPLPQMGRIDPKGNCHWEWVMKPFLPPSFTSGSRHWPGLWGLEFSSSQLPTSCPPWACLYTHSQQAGCVLPHILLPWLLGGAVPSPFPLECLGIVRGGREPLGSPETAGVMCRVPTSALQKL